MKRIGQSRTSRGVLLGGAAFIAMVPGLAHAAPAAQAAAATEAAAVADAAAAGLDEIVVTAQKRETSLQDTPIAISVLGADNLVARHVQSLADLGDGAIPSLRVAPFFARNSALAIGLRGIGTAGDANQPARDQAVGVYINGVYLGRAQGLGSALYDVERIEVLKGPQGTLFGRNTEGGAISIVTKKPSGKFGMNTAVGYGNYDGYRVETHVDLPEYAGVALKFDAMVTKRGGTAENPTSSGQPDFNSYDKRGFQIEALWSPASNVTVDYALDTSYDGTTPYLVQLLGKGSLALAPLTPPRTDRVKVADVGAPLRISEGFTWGHRLNLDWDLADWLQLKSITAYRSLKQGQYDNGSVALSAFAPNGLFSRYSIANFRQRQFSQELQLIGHLADVEFVGGAFYYREGVRDSAQTPNSLIWNATGTAYTLRPLNLNDVSLANANPPAGSNIPASAPYDRQSHAKTKSYGAFGQATWTPAALGDRAHLTVGGRFTHDERIGTLDTVNGAVPSYVDANKKTIVGVIPLDASWDRFDPMIDLAFDVTKDVNVYGKWSSGYKAGGANSRSLTYRPFDPEVVKMFELGAKTEFWDRRARLNLAAFYGDLKDVQVDFNAIIVGNTRGTLETTNAATGKTKGLEADFQIQPVTGLTFSVNYAYTKATLSKAFNPFTNTQATIYPLYTPRNAASGAIDYERPLMSATIKAHLDANWAEGQYTSSADPTKSDESFIVNGRIALADIPLRDQAARMEVALWSRNLFNEAHVFYRNFSPALGTFGIFNEPRTYGVEARLRF